MKVTTMLQTMFIRELWDIQTTGFQDDMIIYNELISEERALCKPEEQNSGELQPRQVTEMETTPGLSYWGGILWVHL